MSERMSPAGLDAGRKAYLEAVRAGNGPSEVVTAIVGAYLAVAPATVLPPPRMGSTSAISRALAEMTVGEVRVIEGANASNLSRYFQTARRILGVPDAKWSARSLPGGQVKLIRNSDGIHRRDPTRNVVASLIATMSPGESRIAPIAIKRGGSWQQAKAQARRILNDPTADWTTKATTKGVRVSRKGPHVLYVESSGRLPSAVRSVFTRVCAAYGVATKDIRQPARGPKRLSQARMEIMVHLRALKTPQGEPRYSLLQIGAFVNRHHTTVIHVLSDSEGRARAA